ncbi:MAG: ATP-binding protein [Actinomycetota bacterium]|nr:MAG: ATP-binding protein [Actinomycetota bacterium]
MTVATLTLTAAADLARTARVVSTSVARAGGLDEDTVAEVRQAVGEAVARALVRQRLAGYDGDLRLVLHDDADVFVVEVHDGAPADVEDDTTRRALALAEALAARTEVLSGPQGSVLRLAWPRLDLPSNSNGLLPASS